MISLISPKDGASVSVMTAAQKEFVRRHRAGELHDGDDPFRIIADGDVTDASAPATAVFSWSCDDKTALMTLEISEREDFSVLSGLCVSPVRQSAEDDTPPGVMYLCLSCSLQAYYLPKICNL